MSASPDRPKIKDFLSLAFSAVALTISAASYYVANIRVDDSVIARITDVDIERGTPDDPTNGYKNGFVVLRVAFINTGNRQAIVETPVYQLSDRPDLENGGFGDELGAAPGTFPFVISPKELRLVPLRIPISTFLSSMENGAQVSDDQMRGRGGLVSADPNAYKDLREFFAGIRYSAIDSLGQMQSAWSGMQVSVIVSPRGWQSLGSASPTGGESDVTQLFDRR